MTLKNKVKMVELIRECLRGLLYPRAELVDVTAKTDLVSLICWLEDRKIRQLEVSERATLRKGDSEQWDTVFSSYLTNLGCPYSWENDSLLDCITWLVAHAVAVEYEDIAEVAQDMENTQMAVVEESADENDTAKLSGGIDELGSLIGLTRGSAEEDAGMIMKL
jgi:hypothetical protein